MTATSATTPIDQARDPARVLRTALRANAGFSALSGLLLAAGAGPLGERFGVRPAWILLVIGVGLVGYGLALAAGASRTPLRVAEARTAVVMDVLWVAGSLVVLVAGLLTAAGNWALVAVGDVVLTFAVVQAIGIRRLERSRPV